MNVWTNSRQAPSDLHMRSPKAVEYVLNQAGVPECGMSYAKQKIANWESLPNVAIDSSGASVGPLSFYPVMGMSFKKGGIDYMTTIVPGSGVTARGKYIGVFCGEHDVHLAFIPRCGNIAVMHPVATQQHVSVIEHVITTEGYNTVPISGTLALVILGLLAVRLFK